MSALLTVLLVIALASIVALVVAWVFDHAARHRETGWQA